MKVGGQGSLARRSERRTEGQSSREVRPAAVPTTSRLKMRAQTHATGTTWTYSIRRRDSTEARPDPRASAATANPRGPTAEKSLTTPCFLSDFGTKTDLKASRELACSEILQTILRRSTAVCTVDMRTESYQCTQQARVGTRWHATNRTEVRGHSVLV